MKTQRQFHLLRELGCGTFGTVYLADMNSLSGFRKRVALKLLKSEWSATSEAGQRLRDEARLLGRLRHRNIIQVDDLVQMNGRWGVVMEYVPGVDLEKLVKHLRGEDRTIPVPAALALTASVCNALTAAYSGTVGSDMPLRVVHRDIKPSNILLTPEGEVKVLDFGIASSTAEDREALTGRVRFGSLPYMSPERMLGEPEVPAGDVYAVGCVLAELLLLKRFGKANLSPDLHRDKCDETKEELQRLLDERYPDSDDLGQQKSALLSLILAMLEYSIEDRPSSQDVSVELRRLGRSFQGDSLEEFSAREVHIAPMESGSGAVSLDVLVEQNDTETVSSHATFPATHLDEPPAARGRGKKILFLGSILMSLLVVIGVLAIAVISNSMNPLPVQEDVGVEREDAAPTPSDAIVAPAPSPDAFQEPSEPSETPSPVVAPTPQPVVSAPAPVLSEAPVVSSAPKIRAVKFTVDNVDRIEATCGSISNSGTNSVLLRNVDVGDCTIVVGAGEKTYRTKVTVSKPGGFQCVVEAEQFSCQ